MRMLLKESYRYRPEAVQDLRVDVQRRSKISSGLELYPVVVF